MDFWITLANGLIGLISACIGAYFTLWLQAKKERIKRIDHETLCVEYKAIKKDEEGFYIPGYGRIIHTPDGFPKSKNGSNNVAYIFSEATAPPSEFPQYVIDRSVPL